MQSIDKQWLHARGDLHDATLISVAHSGPHLELAIDDEWVNERGLTLPVAGQSPGRLVLQSVSVIEGDVDAAVGGWVDHIASEGEVLRIHFCDRNPLLFKCGAAMWRSDPAPPI